MRFNGVDLLSVDPRITIHKEYPPGMPARDVITAGGSDGERVYGTMLKADEYRVRVNIACRTSEDGWAVHRKIVAWACSSGETTAELEPTHLPWKAYDAIVKEIENPEFTFGFSTFDVVFLLPRPILHDMFPTTASGSGEARMGIGGTADCRPVFKQTMESSHADGLTITVDSKTAIKLNGSFPAGAVVIIDFATGAITLNGADIVSRLDYQSANWRPGFTPGQHTVHSSDGGTILMTWRNEWM